MTTFTIRYQAGPYGGVRSVIADDEAEALAKVRARIRREMSLPMYSESYRVIGEPEEAEDE